MKFFKIMQVPVSSGRFLNFSRSLPSISTIPFSERSFPFSTISTTSRLLFNSLGLEDSEVWTVVMSNKDGGVGVEAEESSGASFVYPSTPAPAMQRKWKKEEKEHAEKLMKKFLDFEDQNDKDPKLEDSSEEVAHHRNPRRRAKESKSVGVQVEEEDQLGPLEDQVRTV